MQLEYMQNRVHRHIVFILANSSITANSTIVHCIAKIHSMHSLPQSAIASILKMGWQLLNFRLKSTHAPTTIMINKYEYIRVYLCLDEQDVADVSTKRY